MELCDLTLATPEENLACDEALLNFCEGAEHESVLRLWHASSYFVVLGYGHHAATEVNLEFCEERGIPVLRRCTGGGTVLQGPGCLNYSLVLRFAGEPSLSGISQTNAYVLDRHLEVLRDILAAPVERHGHTDLAIGGLKFSGNAQRRGRSFLLFHGCFLIGMDLDLIEKALRMPSRQPDYRLNRSHRDFLMNLRVPEEELRSALRQAWNAQRPLPVPPIEQVEDLVREKYSRPEWNRRF
jgi:lipoate-protein ligase A